VPDSSDGDAQHKSMEEHYRESNNSGKGKRFIQRCLLLLQQINVEREIQLFKRLVPTAT
jgi:hypothetical protein